MESDTDFTICPDSHLLMRVGRRVQPEPLTTAMRESPQSLRCEAESGNRCIQSDQSARRGLPAPAEGGRLSLCFSLLPIAKPSRSLSI